jgi:hypothetical protein
MPRAKLKSRSTAISTRAGAVDGLERSWTAPSVLDRRDLPNLCPSFQVLLEIQGLYKQLFNEINCAQNLHICITSTVLKPSALTPNVELPRV